MATLTPITHRTKSGREVLLGSALPGDGAEVLAVVREIMARSSDLLTTVAEFTYTPEQEDEMFRDYAAHSDKLVIVPRIASRIVGMMDFRPGHRKRIGHQGSFGMSVHPDHQGDGIGRLMLQALIGWCEANPRLETLRLRVHARNARARALYTSLGFVEEGRELRGVKFGPGDYDDVLAMARPV